MTPAFKHHDKIARTRWRLTDLGSAVADAIRAERGEGNA